MTSVAILAFPCYIAYIIMLISHPWPRSTGNMPPAGHNMSPSGDILFGPWAAYFPVYLCQGPLGDEFNEDGTCIYDASYWWDRMCSGTILQRIAPDMHALIDKYIDKMQNVLEQKFNVSLYKRPPVLIRWLEGNEQQPHADKQLNDGTPNPFPTYDINSIIYWNDNFEGGDFYYPEFDIHLPIKAGMAVAHPGDVHYLHGVKPMVSGERWTTPSFYTITELR